eukprot:3915587-Amphidinium_carterae.1
MQLQNVCVFGGAQLSAYTQWRMCPANIVCIDPHLHQRTNLQHKDPPGVATRSSGLRAPSPRCKQCHPALGQDLN